MSNIMKVANVLGVIDLDLRGELAEHAVRLEKNEETFVRMLGEEKTIVECDLSFHRRGFTARIPAEAAKNFLLASNYYLEGMNIGHGMLDFDRRSNAAHRGRVIVDTDDGWFLNPKFLINKDDLESAPNDNVAQYSGMNFLRAITFGKFTNERGDTIVGWQSILVRSDDKAKENLAKSAGYSNFFKYIECPKELMAHYNRTSERGRMTFDQKEVVIDPIQEMLDADEQLSPKVKAMWQTNIAHMAYAYRLACGDPTVLGELNKLILEDIPGREKREADRKERRKAEHNAFIQAKREQRAKEKQARKAKRDEQRKAKEPTSEKAVKTAEAPVAAKPAPKAAVRKPAKRAKPDKKDDKKSKPAKGGKKAAQEDANQAQT